MEAKKESWFDLLESTLQKPGEPTAPKSKSLAELLQQDFATYFETHGYNVMQEYQSRSRWSASRPATSMGARSVRFTSTAETLPKPFSLRERLEDIWDEADAKAGVKKEAHSNRSRRNRNAKAAELGTLCGSSADFVIVDELVPPHEQVNTRAFLSADFSAIEARLLAHMQYVVKPSLIVSTLTQEEEVQKGASNECGQKQQHNTIRNGRGDAANGGNGQTENPDGCTSESRA